MQSFGLETGNIIIGLMPGSRVHEIRRLLPVFCLAVERLSREIPGAQFILLSADAALTPLIRRIVKNHPITITEEHPYDFMNISDLLILCSGTATHEATLMEKPMIVTYRVSALTAALVRSTVDIPFIALPNILAGEFVVPELVRHEKKVLGFKVRVHVRSECVQTCRVQRDRRRQPRRRRSVVAG